MTDARQQRGIELAKVCKITRKDDGSFVVPSQSGNGRYDVRLGRGASDCYCNCPDHEMRGERCKHMYAVEYFIECEQHDDGTETITETIKVIKSVTRPTYPQNWSAYNAAQTNEKDEFMTLLYDLCRDIQTPAQSGRGQRRLPLADAVFAATFKVYSTVSARRFASDLREAQDRGYIATAPHFNSVLNYLENPEVTDVLRDLIALSSAPLASVECDFAVDSTGFTSSRFVRWYDHKYNAIKQEHDWVKAHFCCGVKTNIVTAVEIHDRNASDTPLLPALVDATAKRFKIAELSADKAYASVDNFAAIERVGATPYIAFKSHHTGRSGGLFQKAFHFFCFQKDEFFTHYHKRSNVESTVMMIKSKFRDHVRSKTEVAMKNEVLCKILCHNICCLISAMYELNITPMFIRPTVA